MDVTDDRRYGSGSTSFEAAGGESGIRQLVDDFFDRMGTDPRFARIYEMHPADKSISREKLARFLCGWLGGPKRYQEKFGRISIPGAHQHLPITEVERDQWLTCMTETVDDQPFEPDFKRYLLEQLAVPANAVWRRCTEASAGDG
jgi:hemoglobin